MELRFVSKDDIDDAIDLFKDGKLGLDGDIEDIIDDMLDSRKDAEAFESDLELSLEYLAASNELKGRDALSKSMFKKTACTAVCMAAANFILDSPDSDRLHNSEIADLEKVADLMDRLEDELEDIYDDLDDDEDRGGRRRDRGRDRDRDHGGRGRNSRSRDKRRGGRSHDSGRYDSKHRDKEERDSGTRPLRPVRGGKDNSNRYKTRDAKEDEVEVVKEVVEVVKVNKLTVPTVIYNPEDDGLFINGSNVVLAAKGSDMEPYNEHELKLSLAVSEATEGKVIKVRQQQLKAIDAATTTDKEGAEVSVIAPMVTHTESYDQFNVPQALITRLKESGVKYQAGLVAVHAKCHVETEAWDRIVSEAPFLKIRNFQDAHEFITSAIDILRTTGGSDYENAHAFLNMLNETLTERLNGTLSVSHGLTKGVTSFVADWNDASDHIENGNADPRNCFRECESLVFGKQTCFLAKHIEDETTASAANTAMLDRVLDAFDKGTERTTAALSSSAAETTGDAIESYVQVEVVTHNLVCMVKGSIDATLRFSDGNFASLDISKFREIDGFLRSALRVSKKARQLPTVVLVDSYGVRLAVYSDGGDFSPLRLHRL